jgi:phosphate uptake regulator
MTRENFYKYIKDLEQDVMDMGRMIITAINRSIEALKTLDVNAAKRVINDDALVRRFGWYDFVYAFEHGRQRIRAVLSPHHQVNFSDHRFPFV